MTATLTDRDWSLDAACTPRHGADPDWWTNDSGNLSRNNEKALTICRTLCPVREACRDDYLDYYKRTGGRVLGVIAGGWRFTAKGQPVPAPGEQHLMPARPAVPDRRSFGVHIPNVDRARSYIAAGRAVLAGEPVDAVCRRTGLARTTVHDAASLVRHSTAQALRQVEDGETTLNAAITALRRSGQARRGGPR